MNEEVEIYYYRKNDISDSRDIVLKHATITRERLNRALGEAKAKNQKFVIFEKETTPPDFWLVLHFAGEQSQVPECIDITRVREALEDIARQIDDVLVNVLGE